MRRKGHPSRPRAMTCCFFASLKTLLIPTKATALRRNQRPRASFSLAGFQVTLIGRFWVTAEVESEDDPGQPGYDHEKSEGNSRQPGNHREEPKDASGQPGRNQKKPVCPR